MKNKSYKWTFNEVLQRFETIEKELSLDESLIQGVPWWDRLRNHLFLELLTELGLKETLKKNKTLVFGIFLKKKYQLLFIY